MISHPVLGNQEELLDVLDGFEALPEAGLDLEVDQLNLLESRGVGELGKVHPDAALLQTQLLQLAEFRDSFEEAPGSGAAVTELQQLKLDHGAEHVKVRLLETLEAEEGEMSESGCEAAEGREARGHLENTENQQSVRKQVT